MTSKFHEIRRVSTHFPLFAADVTALLPSAWEKEVRDCSEKYSRWRELPGTSVTSRESLFPEATVAEVGLVAWDTVCKHLPWLDDLYRGHFLQLANSLSGKRYVTSDDTRDCININTMRRGSRYEWHVDNCHLTGLLYASTLPFDNGGQLIFRPDPSSRPTEHWEERITAVSGMLYLFDARESAHCVTQLDAAERISIPMNYFTLGEDQSRPSDLEDYLYS